MPAAEERKLSVQRHLYNVVIKTHLNCVSIAITRGYMGRCGSIIGGNVGVGPGPDKDLDNVCVSPAGGVIHGGQAKLVPDIHIQAGQPQEPVYDL